MKRFRLLRSLCTMIVVLLALAMVLASCEVGKEAPRLRITNSGVQPIQGLVVLFPEEEVIFGDVAPGETTDYRSASEGVYRYAAYRFRVDGQEITQPVLDWVGEQPMPGKVFTYVLNYDPSREPIQQVLLSDVIREK